MSTPYERFLAEELPTGTFGGPIPDTPHRTTSPIEAATHYAELERALAGWNDGEHDPRRRLTPVPDAATSEDAA
jgi:hypothetical protein